MTQAKTPLLTKAEGYEAGVRSEIVPHLSRRPRSSCSNLANEATFDGDEAVTSVGRPSNRTGIELSARYAPLALAFASTAISPSLARASPTPDNGAADVEPGHPGNYIPEAAR